MKVGDRIETEHDSGTITRFTKAYVVFRSDRFGYDKQVHKNAPIKVVA